MLYAEREEIVDGGIGASAMGGYVSTETVAPVSTKETVIDALGKAMKDRPVSELVEAQAHLNLILNNRIEAECQSMRQSAEAIAAATGVPVDKVLDTFLSPTKKRARKSATTEERVKYRHPENPDLKWTGRGRTPAWLEDAMEKFGEQALLAA